MTQLAFRKQDKSLRRQMIVDAAVELFRRKGYQTTTLDDVAGELGITKAALYHYVDGKEDLLFTIYNQAVAAIFEQTNRIADVELPPEEKLRMVIRNHVENIIIGNQSLVYVFFAEDNQLPEKYQSWVRQKKREYDEVVQKIIGEGIEKGVFEPHDPRLLSYAIVGMINWAYQWYRPGLPFSPGQIADLFIDLLERGYLEDKTTQRTYPRPVPKPDPTTEKPPSKEQTLQRMKSLSRELETLIDDLKSNTAPDEDPTS
jgi:AcrR family transcriptional regulator